MQVHVLFHQYLMTTLYWNFENQGHPSEEVEEHLVPWVGPVEQVYVLQEEVVEGVHHHVLRVEGVVVVLHDLRVEGVEAEALHAWEVVAAMGWGQQPQVEEVEEVVELHVHQEEGVEVEALHAWEVVVVAVGRGQQPQQALLYLKKAKEVEVEVKLQPLMVEEEVGEE